MPNKWPYNTKTWQILRKQVLRRDEGLCQICLYAGKEVPASHVDHIKAIEDGGEPFDMANLQSLCKSCHSRKTAIQDRGFGNPASIGGCDVDGYPTHPDHPWNQK